MLPRAFIVQISKFVFIVGTAALAAVGCNDAPGTADAAAAGSGRGGRGSAAVPVSTTHVVEKSVPQVVRTIGTVEAYTTVEVRAQVSGTLTDVSFTEGQEVTAGQLLFTLDARPFQVALQQVSATLAKDMAQADNAKAQLARADDLLAKNIMSKADHDTLATSVRALVESTNVDQAAVDAAKLNLQYTKITAPISGRTGALLVHQGTLVRTTDATAMVVINQVAPVRVVFGVPADFLGQIRANQAASRLPVQARAVGSDDAASTGSVTFIDNAIDPGTSTVKLKGEFANGDKRLWPGELVEATLRLGVDPHAIVVPTAAIQNGQQGQFVYVVGGDKKVSVRPVKVLRTNGDDVIVADGLKVGEEVVTDGQLALVAGSTVSIKPPVGGRGDRP